MDTGRPFERDVMRSLGQIEGKVDGILIEQKQQRKEVEAITERVGSLEKYRAKVAGIAATIGAGVSYLVSLVDF